MYPRKLKAVIQAKLISGEWTGATDVDETPVITVNGRIMPMKPIAEYFGINIKTKRSKGKTHEDMDTIHSTTNT